FEVQWVAGPPLVERPVSASFDEPGRLYVTDSSGSNEKSDKQLQQKPHRVVRLQDTDGDGRFDNSVVFADKMMFPEGCLWCNGSLYVAAPPTIWKLTDTDGDGLADTRVEWHQGKTLTGCANDLHGPYLGPDGWLYWCKGAFAEQTYQLANGKTFKSRAAHVFRKRPDGSGLEPVLTGGMDNPVGLAFTPGGERIVVGTFFQHPEAGKRDGILHAIYGGVYGKVNDVLDNHQKTGDLMPIMTHLGPAAPCSVLRYRSRVFGDEFQDNLFVCAFNLHKVTRHILEPDGATFRTRDSDFLVSDNPDFHPTDVTEDADGSLLVLDTGGWYKLCCPTAQLAKPDVLGAIYRVRKKGASKLNDPRGVKISWTKSKPTELARFLGDERPMVRDRAIAELAKRGPEAVKGLRDVVLNASAKTRASPSQLVEARRNALWALTRIDSPAARQAVREALNDKDDSVRQVAVHSISVGRDAGAVKQLLAMLENPEAQLQRAAAEALGRIGDKTAMAALLAAASAPHDRVLEHSLTFALIELDDAETVRRLLDKAEQASRLALPDHSASKTAHAANPSADATVFGASEAPSLLHRAALIALDQMDNGGVKPETVTPLLSSNDPVLKQTASWIVGHHPDWGGALGGFFRERLAAKILSDSDHAELQQQLAQFARHAAIQDLLAEQLRDSTTPKASRLTALRAMAQAGVKESPSAWTRALPDALSSDDEQLVRQAVATARSLPAPKTHAADLTSALFRVGRVASAPAKVRLDALA
ncbi:MAG TPA: PVC-type heme-binding CxxCH protein, partial [Verrucomicrobiae bacterium]